MTPLFPVYYFKHIPLTASLFTFCLICCFWVGCGEAQLVEGKQLPAVVDFNYHIKPILSDRCFACHGPDRNKREAGLRLDTETGAKDSLLESGNYALVGGSLHKSAVYDRIHSQDPEEVMPPPDFKLSLSAYEIALIEQWIQEGAVYKQHWSFISPQKPKIAHADKGTWAKNELDLLVLQQLKNKGLSPNHEASKEVLLRRLSLDLRGLPPTIDEIDAFLADSSADAYEKVVNQFLGEKAYGERMAMEWLDVARYADSHGYSQDGFRRMWPWRDWVIEAFNDNIPYDQFILWQLAGDLIPKATKAQRMATAFYRNHRINSEGGIVAEEYRVEYVAERTNTTATAFLGLTMECARCHDHKYDPLSQKEYYELFSFFNSVNERGLVQKDGNSGPAVLLTNEEIDRQLAFLNHQINKKEEAIQKYREQFTSQVTSHKISQQTLNRALMAHYPFDRFEKKTSPNVVNAKFPAKLPKQHQAIAGIKGRAASFSAYDRMRLGEIAAYDRDSAFSFSYWVKLEERGKYVNLLHNLAGKNEAFYGYQTFVMNQKIGFRLIHALPADLVEIRSKQNIAVNQWLHLVFNYDGSGKADGLQIYMNGQLVETDTRFDQLTQSIRIKDKKRDLKLGGVLDYATDIDTTRAMIDELKIYQRTLSQAEVITLYQIDDPKAKNTSITEDAWRIHFTQNSPKYKKLFSSLQQSRQSRYQLLDSLKNVMVMQDLPQTRPAFILDRGSYDAPKARVFPSIPTFLATSSSQAYSPDRLGLAQWLVSKHNPLTARVTVNRFWQMYFGRGLVATTEDFGSQGALPSHPALLDWLAVDFQESGWDIKALQKKIVMSATYRQSSTVSEAVRKSDPENTYLGRGPSYRLPAEMIRDNALAASGLLVRTIGGPSVKPYQPPGLWIEKNISSNVLQHYVPDIGDKLYRRSMYTFWRRTSPPPAMTTFDAPTRDFCMVRRQRTSTPLQALVLLNDPQFVEASRVLGARMIREGGDSTPTRISFGYKRLTGRTAEAPILKLLTDLFHAEYQDLLSKPEEAFKFLCVGDYPQDESLNPIAVAAYGIVANAMMNLDESIYKR